MHFIVKSFSDIFSKSSHAMYFIVKLLFKAFLVKSPSNAYLFWNDLQNSYNVLI